MPGGSQAFAGRVGSGQKRCFKYHGTGRGSGRLGSKVFISHGSKRARTSVDATVTRDKACFFSLKELFVCLGLGFVSRDALGAGDVYAPALRVRSSPENANGTPSAVHQDCAREGLGEGGRGRYHPFSPPSSRHTRPSDSEPQNHPHSRIAVKQIYLSPEKDACYDSQR